MFFSMKLAINHTTPKIANQIRRYTMTMSWISNYSAITPKIDSKLKGINSSFSKWSTVSRSNNIRAVSTNQKDIKSTVSVTPFASKEDRLEFMAIFPDIVKDLTEPGKHTDIPEVTKRLADILQYNVPKGKLVRGLSIAMAYKMLEKPENLTSKNIKLANILGWCVELLLAYIQVADDIMDNSEIRYGIPCWYRKPEVGLQAVSDATLLNCAAYELLKKYVSRLPCYVPIFELFSDSVFKTFLGQSLDALCINSNKLNLDVFTMNQYLKTVKYKCTYCTSHLPMASAMYLANIFDEELHRQCKMIMIEIGQFNQIRDDFEDCFGDKEITGEIGTDIINGKCTWLAVVALEIATPAQRAIIEQHYGKLEEKSVQAIYNLYEELNLRSAYANYRTESYNLIYSHILQLPKELPHDLMIRLLNQIYKQEY